MLLTGTDADFTETTAIDDDRGHGRTERRTPHPPTTPCSPAHVIERALDEVTDLLRGWRSTARGGEELADAFERLLGALLEHMALEEKEILPLAVVKAVLAHAPFAARMIMPIMGPRMYATHAKRVHGTPTPPCVGS